MCSELDALSEVLPRSLTELAGSMIDGSLDLSVEHHGLSEAIHKLSMVLVVCALFLGCAIMVTFAQTHDVRIVGGVGVLASMLGALWSLKRGA